MPAPTFWRSAWPAYPKPRRTTSPSPRSRRTAPSAGISIRPTAVRALSARSAPRHGAGSLQPKPKEKPMSDTNQAPAPEPEVRPFLRPQSPGRRTMSAHLDELREKIRAIKKQLQELEELL